ncbi:hypothetical protein NJ7G_0396 [Natrinema sp. J7-2]|nr:hypothetical protein NJ7G_0396 [Natrinema sp. J7-2]
MFDGDGLPYLCWKLFALLIAIDVCYYHSRVRIHPPKQTMSFFYRPIQ